MLFSNELSAVVVCVISQTLTGPPTPSCRSRLGPEPESTDAAIICHWIELLTRPRSPSTVHETDTRSRRRPRLNGTSTLGLRQQRLRLRLRPTDLVLLLTKGPTRRSTAFQTSRTRGRPSSARKDALPSYPECRHRH